MLLRLEIKNFALLRDAEIAFNPGFTAVTGETGAGKSLFVNAITFLVGGKAAPGVVRDGARVAIVEGEFSLDSESQEKGFSAGKSLLIRRELTTDGRSRAFIQDSPVTLKTLARNGSELIDITAQRAFSHLLEPSRHLDFLDQFAGLNARRNTLTDYSTEFSTLEKKLRIACEKKRRFQERQDLIDFQLSEINDVNPEQDEDDRLNAEIRKLEHFEEFHDSAHRFNHLLSSGETAVDPTLAEAQQLLESLSGIDPALKELTSEHATARNMLKEIAHRVSEERQHLVFEADKLESLRERYHRLQGLIRKYGGSLSAVLDQKQKLIKELSAGDDNQHEIDELEERINKIIKRWVDTARKVSETRYKAAKRLDKKIVNSLLELGIKDSLFEVCFSPIQGVPSTDSDYRSGEVIQDNNDIKINLSERGSESVEFYLSTNPGIKPRPLAQVASGGELSRLLLALKEALPTAENEAVVILDEIDTGVSGKVARLVGKKLKVLSGSRQLVAVTHLPQIASLADNHLKVVKRLADEETESEIIILDEKERINELALLLSDGSLTEAALEQAKNLMEEGKRFA
ncbi:DNA repair protein RecN [bacterium]|nr:DNA repair protein RecN [bacterium]